MKNNINNGVSQGLAAYIQNINNTRLEGLKNDLTIILQDNKERLTEIIQRQVNAHSQIDIAEASINKLIQSNRGGDRGLHGFIAESAEVGVSNARRALEGLNKIYKLIDDNGAADIKVRGIPTQMKFYQDILTALNQSPKYIGMNMMYPKDQIEVINKCMNNDKDILFHGEVLARSKVELIQAKINNENIQRGELHTKWLKPSKLVHEEVQRDTIGRTLRNERRSIDKDTRSRKKDLEDTVKEKRNVAAINAAPSLQEAAEVAIIGSALQGSIEFSLYVFSQKQNGKDIWEFDKNDWKKAGVKTGKGALQGLINGFSIYSMTNFVGLSAPAASAISSSTWGITNAVLQYRTEVIDDEEFMNLVMTSTIDSTASAIGAIIGQTIIPIPIVGAVIGSIMANTAISAGAKILNARELELIQEYKTRIKDYVDHLDEAYKETYNEMLAKFDKIDNIQEYLLDLEVNIELQFIGSIELAKLLEVSEYDILHNESEIDDYFLS